MADLFFGQNCSFALVSRDYGLKKLKFVEGWECGPEHINRRLWFFDSKEAVVVSIFEGISGSFNYLATEEKFFLSMVMNQNPTRDIILDDPGSYVGFNAILNARDEFGIAKRATFVKTMKIAGNPETMQPREEQRSRVGYIAATRYGVLGGTVEYIRALAPVPAESVFRTPEDELTNVSHQITLDFEAAEVNIVNPNTYRNYLAAYKNGIDMTVAIEAALPGTYFTLVGDTITFPAALSAGDIWEFYLAKKTDGGSPS